MQERVPGAGPGPNRSLTVVCVVLALVLVLVLVGLAFYYGYASHLLGQVLMGLGLGIAIAAWAARNARNSFWRRYFTVFVLFGLTAILFLVSVRINPEIEAPKEPKSPNVVFVVGDKVREMKTLDVWMTVKLGYSVPGERARYDCELVQFLGAAATSDLQWSVRVHNSPSGRVMHEPEGDFLHTSMISQPVDPSLSYRTFVPNGALSSSPGRPPNQISICWPSSEHQFLIEDGSNAAISLSGVYVAQGDSIAKLHGPPVNVIAVLKGGDSDWVLDTGPPLAKGSGDVVRKWEYQIDTWGPVYMHSVEARAHSVEKARDEHFEEFNSGVLFGVAAASLITACTELFNRLMAHGDG
ncbi:hypothetical protein ACWCV9_10180 [Streptomyces sp. NPDC001606]